MRGEKDLAIKYANIAIDIESKRISEKIKKEPLFIPILAKISIPFNLDFEEEKKRKLTPKELKAKKHLEEMVEITKKIGYNDLKIINKNKEITQENSKEREK